MKLLLLGTGESGKSTFIKQMRIIHGNGYTLLEKQKYATIIIRNILISMQTLIKAMRDIDLSQMVTPGTGCRSLQSYQTMMIIKDFWKDASVQECFNQQKDYHISDSIAYFLAHLDRINQHDYVPTEQDILRCRVPTTGVVEYSFDIQSHNFRIFDVGGQRTERRKWIHCFEDVTSVLFLAALSDYNETCQHSYDEENG